MSLEQAKQALDSIIKKGRVDLYKPIQIAEVLHQSRTTGSIDVSEVEDYRIASVTWRDDVTLRLANKRSTSSQKYQDDVWNEHAMPPSKLSVLDKVNKARDGLVESYIYHKYKKRQGVIANIIDNLRTADAESFDLAELLKMFVTKAGIKRSIDKAYEIISYSLLETIVDSSNVKVEVSVDESDKDAMAEFADLAAPLLGVTPQKPTNTYSAHIYRVGVTNAADRGLDMWANFGPAVQVKHVTLNDEIAQEIVDQVESDRILIVCIDADADVLATIRKRTGWGRRVCGIVTKANLIEWYERCLRGDHNDVLAEPLLEMLRAGFDQEFPQVREIDSFLAGRGYDKANLVGDWAIS